MQKNHKNLGVISPEVTCQIIIGQRVAEVYVPAVVITSPQKMGTAKIHLGPRGMVIFNFQNSSFGPDFGQTMLESSVFSITIYGEFGWSHFKTSQMILRLWVSQHSNFRKVPGQIMIYIKSFGCGSSNVSRTHTWWFQSSTLGIHMEPKHCAEVIENPRHMKNIGQNRNPYVSKGC